MSEKLKLLYRTCWDELIKVKNYNSNFIDDESTPVLVFGNFNKAKIITAGLNPSEVEFRENGLALIDNKRRFLHFSEVRTALDDAHIDIAFQRSINYFQNNPYEKWFGKYNDFLKGFGASFKDGTACHTDYYSPFATTLGLGEMDQNLSKELLYPFGRNVWKQVLEEIPCAEVIFGHGQGHHLMPSLFNFKSWEVIPVPFKKEMKMFEPFLFQEIRLTNLRTIKLFWWKPNLNGHGLSILKNEEREALGSYIASQIL